MKLTIFVVLVSLIFVCGFIYLSSVSFDYKQTKIIYSLKETTYIVEPYDSLWKIACMYCPDDLDKYEYIKLIEEKNNIIGTIHPGQKLIVLY